MAKVTSEQFIELAIKSKLADEVRLTAAIDSLRKDHAGQLPSDPVDVAKHFETADLLTRWQNEKLLQGKYRGFFLGKHKLLGHLGTGGMSTVYLAEHLIMKHKRAIKVMPKSKLGNNSYLQRFRQEAMAIAAMDHPNIVHAFDIDNDGDTHFIVMEYVEGADLQTLVKKHGPLSFEKVAEYTMQAALGLQHAHDKGLIHRDVKPANLLLNRDSVIKVLDLGLALVTDEKLSSVTMEHNDKILGTADYLAPEQALNSHDIDYRADIYSLGCTMYYLLTGHPPFPEGSIAQRIAKHQKMMPEEIRVSRPDCPGELDGICVKMMQKEARYRYANCSAVAAALQTWLDRPPSDARKLATANAAAVPKRKTARVGGDGESSKNLSSSVSNPSGLKPYRPMDSDPAGKISSILSSGNAADSQMLRKMASASGSIIDSGIDLELDTNAPIAHRRPKARGTIDEMAAEQQAAVLRISQIAKSTSKKHLGEYQTLTQATREMQDAPMLNRPRARLDNRARPMENIRKLSPLVLGIGATVLAVIAIAVGLMIANWVS